MCITDKAKETSSCADLFRCGAASVCLDCGVFALCLGASASLIRLPRCYYYTTCKWCMESHLSSDAWPAPWLAALAAVPRVCCVRGCRTLSLALCAVPLVPGLPCLLAPWSLCCVGGLCAWCPGLLACPVRVGCACPVYGPALWAVWLGPIFRSFIVVSLEGLLKKRP